MANIFDINDDLGLDGTIPEFNGLNNIYLDNKNFYDQTQNSRGTVASKNPPPSYDDWKKTQQPEDVNAFDKFKNFFAQSNKGEKISTQAVSDLWQDLDEDERVLFQLNPKKFIENRITNQGKESTKSESEKLEFAYTKYKQYLENGQPELANALDEKWKFTSEGNAIQKKLDMFEMWKKAIAKFKISSSNTDKAEAQMWADALFDKGMRITSDGNGGFTMEETTDAPNMDDDDESLTGANAWYNDSNQDSKTWRDINDQKQVNSKQMRQLIDMTASYKPEYLTIWGKWRESKLGLTEWFSKNGNNLSEDEKEWMVGKTRFGQDAFMMFNDYVKFITGAQMSEKEVQRLRRAMPSLEFSTDFSNFFRPEADSPSQFETKMDALTTVTRDSYARYNFLTDDNIFQTLIRDGVIKEDQVERLQKNYDSDREGAFYKDDMNNTRFNTKRNYLFTSEEVGDYRKQWRTQAFEKAKADLIKSKSEMAGGSVGLSGEEKARLMFESSVKSFDLFGMNIDGNYPFTLKEKKLYQQYGLIN